MGSGVVKCSLDTVKENTRGWTNEGGRLDSLCKDLHDDDRGNGNKYSYLGNLFRLVGVTKEDVRTLNTSGQKRKEKITNLERHSIPEAIGNRDFYGLTHSVFELLLKKANKSISTYLQKGLSTSVLS
ncbi:hypothetical protein BJX64DRAFT_14509 [Aspergillus heterothallicus]